MIKNGLERLKKAYEILPESVAMPFKIGNMTHKSYAII
jgi:hypothetical protein